MNLIRHMSWALALSSLAVVAERLPGQRINYLNSGWGASVTQSSTSGSSVASLAADRSRSGNNTLCCTATPYLNTPSVAITTNTPLSWWQASWASPQMIEEVLLFNRADCCADRLGNFRVELFNGATRIFTQDFFTNGGHVSSGGMVRVLPPNGPVSITLCRITKIGASPAGDHRLQLAEVEAWGPHPTALVNVARHGTASSSVVGIGSPGPHVLNDGNTDGWSPNGSVFWTLSFPNSWVRIDLPAAATIRQISLYPRVDALMERMSRFRVRLVDGATDTLVVYSLTNAIGMNGWHYYINNTTTRATHIIVESWGQGQTAEEMVQLSEVEVWAQNFNIGIQGEALPFGVGCESATGAPGTRIAPGVQPRIGGSYTTQITNGLPIGGGQYGAFLMTGFSASSGLSQTLPAFSGTPTVPGCWMLCSPDILTFGFGSSPTIDFPFSLPFNLSFLNLRFYQQALLLDPTSPYANGVVFGNAQRITVGI